MSRQDAYTTCNMFICCTFSEPIDAPGLSFAEKFAGEPHQRLPPSGPPPISVLISPIKALRQCAPQHRSRCKSDLRRRTGGAIPVCCYCRRRPGWRRTRYSPQLAVEISTPNDPADARRRTFSAESTLSRCRAGISKPQAPQLRIRSLNSG